MLRMLPALLFAVVLTGCVYIDTTSPAPPPRTYYYTPPPVQPPPPPDPTQPVPLQPR